MSGESYGWSTAAGPHSCAYIAPAVLNILRELRVRRVLDLGCGNGRLCADMAAAGFEVVGVEPDERGLSIARAAHPRVRFHRFSLDEDPKLLLEAETPFDAVVSTEVVEHLYAPDQLPRYAAGVLKPGGFLIVSTPYHGYLKNLAISILDKWDDHHTPLWKGGHIKFWSRRTLGALLEANGFEKGRFYGVGRAPFLWKSMILAAKAKA